MCRKVFTLPVDRAVVYTHLPFMIQNALWERFAKLSFVVLGATVFLFGGAIVIEPSVLLAMAVAAVVFLATQSVLQVLLENNQSFTPTFVHFSRNQIKHCSDPLLI